MKKAVIREHHFQQPFEPYQLVLASGDAFNIPQPDFLFLGEPPEEGELEDEKVIVYRRPDPNSGGSPKNSKRLAASPPNSSAFRSASSTSTTSSPT